MATRCLVFGCTDSSATKVKLKNAQTGEEQYYDVCRPHFDQIERDRSSASWDPVLAAVRVP